MAESQEENAHYTSPHPERCHACTAVAIRADEYDKADHSRALRFRAERIE